MKNFPSNFKRLEISTWNTFTSWHNAYHSQRIKFFNELNTYDHLKQLVVVLSGIWGQNYSENSNNESKLDTIFYFGCAFEIKKAAKKYLQNSISQKYRFTRFFQYYSSRINSDSFSRLRAFNPDRDAFSSWDGIFLRTFLMLLGWRVHFDAVLMLVYWDSPLLKYNKGLASSVVISLGNSADRLERSPITKHTVETEKVCWFIGEDFILNFSLFFLKDLY